MKKIETFRLDIMNSNLDVNTLSETWLKASISSGLVSIDGYTFLRHDRTSTNNRGKVKTGGGVGIYIKSSVEWDSNISRNNLCNGDTEIQWVTISRPKTKRIVIANVYRPPDGNIENAFHCLKDSLKEIKKRDKCELIVLGDFNIDMAKQSEPAAKKLTMFNINHNLMQQITNATRKTVGL